MTADPTPPPIDARPPWRMLLLLAGLTVLVYARAMTGDFLFWDDAQMVVGNADLRPGGGAAIARYWLATNPHIGLYAPLTYSLYFVLARVADLVHGSLHPLPFHLAELALHLAGGLFLWTLLRRLVVDERAALAGVAIFWLHPVQAEPVSWIGSLNTVLSGALVLAALALHVRAATLPTRRGRAVAATLACVAFALAAFAKPAAVGAPLAAIAIDRFALGSAWRGVIARAVPWLLIAAPMMIVARLAQPAAVVVPPSPPARLIVAADTVGFYLARIVAPVNQSIDYGRRPEHVLRWEASTFAYVGIAAAAAIAVALLARRRPIALAAAGVFLAGLLPVLGLVPFDFQFFSGVADRYLYWSMAGVAIAVAAVVARRPHGARLDRVVAVVTVGAMAVATFAQTAHWADDDAAFDRALRLNPASRAVLRAYAERAMRMSERTADAKVLGDLYADAASRYHAGLARRPDDGQLHVGLGILAWAAGDYVTADREFETGTRMGAEPDWAGFNMWGVALAGMSREDEAIPKFERAARMNPISAFTLTNWASVELRRARRDVAASLVDRALVLKPNDPRALDLQRTLRESPATSQSAEKQK